MKPIMPFRRAISDPAILGSAFPRKAGEPDSWLPWRALGCAIMGERLTAAERDAYTQIIGMPESRAGRRANEVLVLKSRRSGGTSFAAAMSIYQAALCDYSDVLDVGERATLLFQAPTARQAQVAFQRSAGLIDASPMLSGMVIGRTEDSITLSNSVTLEVRPASYRSVRGLTLAGAVVDESAFLMAEGAANSDTELLAALRPALLSTRGLLLIISTPYARQGETFELHEKHFGKDGPVLVAKGTWETWNPTLDREFVDREMQRDRPKAESEYYCVFRSDVCSFIDPIVLAKATDHGVTQRPYMPGVSYVCFADGASGLTAGGDAFCAAVAHREGDVLVVDAVLIRKAPFNAAAVLGEVCHLAKAYSCSEIVSDRVAQGFMQAGIADHALSWRASPLDKSALYLNCLPLFGSGKIRLTGEPIVIEQFLSLERKAGSFGMRDRVDARGNKSEDAANVVAGAVALLTEPVTGCSGWVEFYRRECIKVGVDPNRRFDTDYDDVQAPAPDHGWSF
ncbi:hypothetical protein [Bradyrhizobium quebecense]|uniref:Uncharacterized protein n=2 Tax=Bradyrhizobium quebecense TaxID=2748629 RepID=A0ACD3V9U9_9BRAD|nr:hypothetical protein [Bradyrhizobium quebecense]UGY03271.1 hypothetical protein J4P68_0000365 [Bradyrhizobium quebecense]